MPAPSAIRRRTFPLWVWLVPLVAGVHLVIFWALADWHFMPKPWPENTPAQTPNFTLHQEVVVDPATGKKMLRSDFTVSTKIAAPSSKDER